ncbi:MAG: 7-cyano-7-deazaguanine synthase QueC [Gammaproteobacteria bacterium]|nr:7-cyano-7-deazaguanine synthase QueC [Gammaproteobacteria bacterium]
MTSALILLSGGLDSATTLAIARAAGFECYAISFAYGQRNHIELEAAEAIARKFAVLEHRVVPIDLSAFGGSALTDNAIDVPEASEVAGDGIPVTYVPARNTVFLSLALAWAEVLRVRDIFIGVNAVDYSGYPDCRPEFIRAFETMANLATKAGVEGDGFTIHTPLIDLRKADIIERGLSLGVDYRETVSCYQPNDQGEACGRCDSCRLRREGFAERGVADPTRYVPA